MEEHERRDGGFHEECGVVGILGRGNVVDLLYYGLYALQHRGQQGAGICVHNGEKTWVIKGLGLVHDALTEHKRASIQGYMGIAHNRYATTGRSTKIRNVQPLLVDYKGGKLSIAHNGNLTNVAAIRKEMEESGSIFQTTTDSEIVLHLIARAKGKTLPDRVVEAVSQLEGALTCLIMNEEMIIGYRDPNGVRPLSLGRFDGMHVLASESCAFDLLGAEFLREVAPGELVILTKDGVESRQALPAGRAARCMFELVYFSRPDSVVYSEPVNRARREMGRMLARRHPVDADIVIAIPDSSNSAAQGYADESGLPFELGLIRNHYVGRTFIGADQAARVDAVRVKFNPVRSILEGKRVIAVDDSIVRGTTSRKLVDLLYKAGAKEVHFRVSSPPVTYPCHYGVNTPSREELIASSNDVDAICEYIGATSLGYLTLADLEQCVGQPREYCYACWTGDYPIPVPELANSSPFDVD